MGAYELPMFPLGSVLFPTAFLPLRVFEPRYLAMIGDLLAGDGRFGVTLIERGSEVGGDDVRASVGCVAEIRQAQQATDGTWSLLAVGIERIDVVEWLADDPYPRAFVTAAPDDDLSTPDLAADPRWLELDTAFRTLMRLLRHRTGQGAPNDLELSTDQAVATFQMASVAPINPLDRYRILSERTADGRRRLLLESFEGITLLVGGPESN